MALDKEQEQWVKNEVKFLLKCGIPEHVAFQSLIEICEAENEMEEFDRQLVADVLRISNLEPGFDDGMIALQLQLNARYAEKTIGYLYGKVQEVNDMLTEVTGGEKVYFEFERRLT